MVFSDSVDGSMVDKQLQKSLQFQLTNRFFMMIDIFTIPDLILHILYLFLCRIKAHTSHHISNSTQRNLTIQLPSFSCMLIFWSDLTVVKEVFQITHNLAIRSSFQKIRKWVAFRLLVKTLSKNWEINFPHIDT